jgi:hypothetical protein
LADDLGALRSYDELDVAIENLEQSKQLVDRLPIVRLIEKSVELGGDVPSRRMTSRLANGVAAIAF